MSSVRRAPEPGEGQTRSTEAGSTSVERKAPDVVASSGRSRRHDEKPVIGWREWVALPALGVERIKAKIDTGARSSALHAYDVNISSRDGRTIVTFKILPYQRSSEAAVHAEAPLVEYRSVKNSGGHVEKRPVVETVLEIGGRQGLIEVTLTSRDEMGFRMLLGRQAVRRNFVVDPGRSFLQGRRTRQGGGD